MGFWDVVDYGKNLANSAAGVVGKVLAPLQPVINVVNKVAAPLMPVVVAASALSSVEAAPGRPAETTARTAEAWGWRALGAVMTGVAVVAGVTAGVAAVAAGGTALAVAGAAVVAAGAAAITVAAVGTGVLMVASEVGRGVARMAGADVDSGSITKAVTNIADAASAVARLGADIVKDTIQDIRERINDATQPTQNGAGASLATPAADAPTKYVAFSPPAGDPGASPASAPRTQVAERTEPVVAPTPSSGAVTPAATVADADKKVVPPANTANMPRQAAT